jgi:hypothetical protein
MPHLATATVICGKADRMVRSAGILACAALWASAASSEAKCAMVELGPAMITPATAKVPADGGVLVGWTSSHDYGRTDGDPSVRKTWKATAGGQPVELVIETLAPGLSVYRPKTKDAFVLGDGKQQLGSFARVAAGKLDLPAPAPQALVLDARPGRYGSSEFSISATFASIPDAAVAVILYRAGKPRVALSFGSVDRGQKQVLVYDGPHHCSFPPPGTTQPAKDDRVVLAWVDAFGHVSDPSAALEVKPAPKP